MHICTYALPNSLPINTPKKQQTFPQCLLNATVH